jgi:hypothetical protein
MAPPTGPSYLKFESGVPLGGAVDVRVHHRVSCPELLTVVTAHERIRIGVPLRLDKRDLPAVVQFPVDVPRLEIGYEVIRVA